MSTQPAPHPSAPTKRPSRRGAVRVVASWSSSRSRRSSPWWGRRASSSTPTTGRRWFPVPPTATCRWRYLASTASGCVVYDESINSLNAMIAQAAKDGVTLRPISCYRDYAGQVAAREEWCARGACQMAAVPGTSNHGWGKAIDFRDQSGELTFDSAGYAWLKTWAGLLRLDPPARAWSRTGPCPRPGTGSGSATAARCSSASTSASATPRWPRPAASRSATSSRSAVGPDTVSVAGLGDRSRPGRVDPRARVRRRRPGYAVTADKSRPDVNAAFPLYAGAQHGFSAPRSPPPPASTRCACYAINVSGTGFNVMLGCRTVTVPDPAAASTAGPTTTTTTAPAAPAALAPTTSTVAPDAHVHHVGPGSSRRLVDPMIGHVPDDDRRHHRR